MCEQCVEDTASEKSCLLTFYSMISIRLSPCKQSTSIHNAHPESCHSFTPGIQSTSVSLPTLFPYSQFLASTARSSLCTRHVSLTRERAKGRGCAGMRQGSSCKLVGKESGASLCSLTQYHPVPGKSISAETVYQLAD